MSIPKFLEIIQEYSADNVFNPYQDVCNYYDTVDSPKFRLKVLKEILQKAENKQS